MLGSQIGYISFLVVTEKNEIELEISLKSTGKEKKWSNWSKKINFFISVIYGTECQTMYNPFYVRKIFWNFVHYIEKLKPSFWQDKLQIARKKIIIII